MNQSHLPKKCQGLVQMVEMVQRICAFCASGEVQLSAGIAFIPTLNCHAGVLMALVGKGYYPVAMTFHKDDIANMGMYLLSDRGTYLDRNGEEKQLDDIIQGGQINATSSQPNFNSPGLHHEGNA